MTESNVADPGPFMSVERYLSFIAGDREIEHSQKTERHVVQPLFIQSLIEPGVSDAHLASRGYSFTAS